MDTYNSLMQGLKENETPVWELYHENSKFTPYQKPIPYNELQQWMSDLIVSYDYFQYPFFPLESPIGKFDKSFSEILTSRQTMQSLQPVEISFEHLSSLLHYGYGITRSNEGTTFPHPFRTVPSAGALYPLEIYFHHNYIQDIPSGLYHYSSAKNGIEQLKKGDFSKNLKETFIQPEVAYNASMLIFITALMDRSTYKYGERAYRFAHIEAGHLAQNICLVAEALNLGVIPIGGFIDKKADDFLEINGLTHSTIYCMAIGSKT